MEVFEAVKTVNGHTIFAVFFQNSSGVKVPKGYMVNMGGRRFKTLELACEDANLTTLESNPLDEPDEVFRPG